MHHEISDGGLAQLLNGSDIALTVMDPDALGSGGVRWLNNLTGKENRSFRIYQGNIPYFGKGNGLGDLEIIA